MTNLRIAAVLACSVLALACGGEAQPVADSDTDDLSSATVSMAMVRDNPALAPGVLVPKDIKVAGRKPALVEASALKNGLVWSVDDPSAAWLYAANGLGQFKSLADPAMDADGAKVGAYARKPGDLFGTDGAMKWDEVSQGYLGDCYFAASLSAVLLADRSGAFAKQVVVPKTEGGKVVSYVATFFQANGRKVKVEVDPDLPHSSKSGRVLYLRSTANQIGSEEWAPSLVEKAFAAWHKSYGAIGGGGSAADAIHALTGQSTNWFDPASAATVAAIDAAGRSGRAQVACTFGEAEEARYTGTGVHSNHCYTLRGVVTKAGKTYVQLRNPWGPAAETEPVDDGVQDGLFDLEVAKFQRLYQSVSIVP